MEQEESFYIILELPDYENTDILSTTKEWAIRDLDNQGDQPVLLQLDEKIFKGNIEETIGTFVVFEEKKELVEGETDGIKQVVGVSELPICATKKIRFERCVLKPKPEIKPTETSESMVPSFTMTKNVQEDIEKELADRNKRRLLEFRKVDDDEEVVKRKRKRKDKDDDLSTNQTKDNKISENVNENKSEEKDNDSNKKKPKKKQKSITKEKKDKKEKKSKKDKKEKESTKISKKKKTTTPRESQEPTQETSADPMIVELESKDE